MQAGGPVGCSGQRVMILGRLYALRLVMVTRRPAGCWPPWAGCLSSALRCVSCRKPIDAEDFLINEVPPRQLPRMVALLSGRMPDQSDPSEVLASFTLAQDNGVRIGSVIRAQLGSPAQLRGGPADSSPALHPALRVVGIVAAESEFPSGASLHYDLFATTAFAAAVNHPRGAAVDLLCAVRARRRRSGRF
jgi:hypothetical protein